MMKGFIPLVVAVLLGSLFAPDSSAQAVDVVRTAKDGIWSNPNTWVGGKLPPAGAKVQICEGHTIVYDVHSDQVIRSLHISGTLTFAHDQNTRLDVGLIRIAPGNEVTEDGFDCTHVPDKNRLKSIAKQAGQPGYSALCVCCDNKAALLVGTPEQPVDRKHTAVIRLHHIEGMDKDSCPAIVCCGGRMDFHGSPMKRTWVKLDSEINPRTGPVTEIRLSEEVPGWKVGDALIITGTKRVWVGGATRYRYNTEERTIKAIKGKTLIVDTPFTRAHSGQGSYRAEVANLSRNVIVESAAPAGVRGHTMYHFGSAGSISYAEFRHLGKKDLLGRYSIHFHLAKDSMRGSSVIGASIHHSHNRWITVHGTQYLVVRDCVGYQSIGHGFFLEDGSEVYNVFDRNLACQAVRGKPLPKQALPFDPNDGAGFWWANSLNTFTRNVAAECETYGFRFQATPVAGVSDNRHKIFFGNAKKPFDLTRPVRQQDGSYKSLDIRTLPFVRFEDNETHSNGRWGMNLGQGNRGIGPDKSTPFVIRNLNVWEVVGGWGVEVPNVLIDGMTIHQATYGVRESSYVAQDYRNVSINSRGTTITTLKEYLASNNSAGSNRHRQPGWPQGSGDGGPRYQSAKIEVVNLKPVDKLPPITVVTNIRKAGNKLLVRGTTTDAGNLRQVMVNGTKARLLDHYGNWEVNIPINPGGLMVLTAGAEDAAGNVEISKHVIKVAVR